MRSSVVALWLTTSFFGLACSRGGRRTDLAAAIDASSPSTLDTAAAPTPDGGADWIDKLPKANAEKAPTVPFSCDAIKVHRGWRFRGEVGIRPTAAAELAAFHVHTRVTDGFAARLVAADGHELDTEFSFVLADEKATPMNRFFNATTAHLGPIDIVAIAPVPKGTRSITFRARNPSLRADEVCDVPIVLGEGAPWPPAPRYEVLRTYVTKRKTFLLLARTKYALPFETSAPSLTHKLPPGYRDEEGRKVQEYRSSEPSAWISANAAGEPAPFDPKAQEHFVVAEYAWESPPWPSEYTAGDRIASLPAPTPWTISPSLGAALDESRKIILHYDSEGGAILATGGQSGFMKALSEGKIRRRY